MSIIQKEKNIEKFIQDLKQIFPDLCSTQEQLELINKTYIDSYKLCKFICPNHGEFEREPRIMLYTHSGCPRCNKISQKKQLALTFIDKAKQIFPEYFQTKEQLDIIIENYVNSKTECMFLCPEHGEFYKYPETMLHYKSGCPSCSGHKVYNRGTSNFKFSKRITTEQFIEKCKEYHDAYRSRYRLPNYDYSKTIYVSMKSTITITCPLHGDFVVNKACNHSAAAHTGCPECGRLISRKKRLLTQEEFIEKCNKVHGFGKYDYSKTVYSGYASMIKYWCPRCKQYVTQLANNHVNGEGCMGCARGNGIINNKLTREQAISRIKKTNTQEFLFDKFEHRGNDCKAILGCKIHGYFESYMSRFLRKDIDQSCPKCTQERLRDRQTSNAEKELLSQLREKYPDLTFEENVRFNFPNKISELDIYIPEIRLGIEYNGIYWHSDKLKERTYHQEKKKLFETIGIRCFMLYEDLQVQEVIENVLFRYIDWLLSGNKKLPEELRKLNNYDYISLLDLPELTTVSPEIQPMYFADTTRIPFEFYDASIPTHNRVYPCGTFLSNIP